LESPAYPRLGSRAGAGLCLPVIGALLGHARPGTTACCTRLLDDPLRAAAERAAAEIHAERSGGPLFSHFECMLLISQLPVYSQDTHEIFEKCNANICEIVEFIMRSLTDLG
jgi:hypothetical protein